MFITRVLLTMDMPELSRDVIQQMLCFSCDMNISEQFLKHSIWKVPKNKHICVVVQTEKKLPVHTTGQTNNRSEEERRSDWEDGCQHNTPPPPPIVKKVHSKRDLHWTCMSIAHHDHGSSKKKLPPNDFNKHRYATLTLIYLEISWKSQCCSSELLLATNRSRYLKEVQRNKIS